MAVGSLISEKLLRLIFLIPAESIPVWLGVVNGLFNFGAVIGSLIGSQFSAKLGRVGTLLLVEGLAFFFHFLMLTFDGIWVLIVMRIGSGICKIPN
jgi:MFS family permease